MASNAELHTGRGLSPQDIQGHIERHQTALNNSPLEQQLRGANPDWESLPELERVTRKMIYIMQDPDLAMEVGGALRDLIVPGIVAQRGMTQEQAERIRETENQTVESLLSPEMIAEANIQANSRSRNKRSPFSGL